MSGLPLDRRVVVTGMGAISPLGSGHTLNWERMKRGESGIGPITRFEVSTMPVRIAGEIEPLPRVPEDELTDELGIQSRFALVAGREAWADGGLEGAGVPAERVGVYLGSGKGILHIERLVPGMKAALTTRDFDYAAFLKRAGETLSAEPRKQERYHQAGSHLGRAVGAAGPNWVCITACAAGNHAIGEAMWAIRRGDADVILAGGTHSQIDPMSVSGYSTLGALSERNDEPTKASRPFDRKRDGFVLGEGSGVLVLEELEHAKARGATIHAELIGYGNSADSYRVTDPHPEGAGAELAMREALRGAKLKPADIDYINAHGTSTAQNDRGEAQAIGRIFGPKGEAPPVSSVKSMIGHMIAAAGAIEAMACVHALRDGILPPTINYENPDPECDLDVVPNEAREAPIRYALNNSFGFGGQNIVTVFKRFDG
ncbi:MAG: beta-ketoacyl-[acyl-carrier-protein] synthase family protein [Planctomycetota bacterium]|jgi:3-oxoacyl-[acyl-carrier-protein] synthase II